MVAITFSGHGIQVGEGILMLPSGVSSEPHEMQKEGFSHNELFTILYKELHKKTQAHDVYYLLIIDACRETTQESAVGFSGTLDPVYRDAVGEEAMRWALCAGTSRGSPAADAGTLDASHLGAFTSCVISEECGLFQPNVPVTTAIKLASERVRNNQSRCQAPLTLLDNISCDFCLYDDVPAEQERFDVCVCYRDMDGHHLLRPRHSSGRGHLDASQWGLVRAARNAERGVFAQRALHNIVQGGAQENTGQ